MKTVRALGIFFAGLGLLANPFVIERLLAADGRIDNNAALVTVLLFQGALVSAGLTALLRPQRILKSKTELVLLGVVSVFSLLAGEGLLRLFWQEPAGGWYGYPVGLYLPDERYGYRFKPNFRGKFPNPPYDNVEIAINSRGLRDDEHAYEKATGTLRILGLGDSVAFGAGVTHNDTFLEVLEKRLKEEGLNAEVINSGVNGYDFDQERAYYLNEGSLYRADVVLLNIVLNDIQEVSAAKLRALQAQHEALLQKERLASPRRETGVRAALKRYCTLCAVFAELIRSAAGEREEYNLAYFNILMNREWTQKWPAFQDKLLRLNEEIKKDKGKLVLTLFPQTPQLSKAEGLTLIPQQRIQELGRAHDIPFIDLTPHLDVPNYKEYYLGGDSTHLSIRGHAFVADILKEKLLPYASQ